MRKFSTLAPSRLCRDDGNVTTADSLAIEGNSVVTLYAQNYNPPLAVVPPASRQYVSGTPRASVTAGSSVRMYRPNGALAGTSEQHVTPGVYVVQGQGMVRVTAR
jgi:hypothetical protein